jgi:tRNA-specific 2-thiouridylase
LAEHFGIRDYPCPAGGCLLTDPGFARRMKDLILNHPNFSINDVHLLKIGRHFRFSPKTKLVVGRNEEENQKIQTFAQEEDILLRLSRFPGPLSLLRGEVNGASIEKAAALTIRYSKARDMEKGEVLYKKVKENSDQSLFVSPVSEAKIREWMICE